MRSTASIRRLMVSAYADQSPTCPAMQGCQDTCVAPACFDSLPRCIRAVIWTGAVKLPSVWSWRRAGTSPSCQPVCDRNWRCRWCWHSTLRWSFWMSRRRTLIPPFVPSSWIWSPKAREAGRTVIFSSHVLGEIEQTCDRVGFLRRGRLARQLIMSKLFQRHRITGFTESSNLSIPEPWQDQVTLTTEPRGDRLRCRIDTAGDLADLLPWLHSLNLEQLRIEPLGLRGLRLGSFWQRLSPAWRTKHDQPRARS